MWTHKYLIKAKNVTSDLLAMLLLMLPSKCLAFNSTGACCYHTFNLLSTWTLGLFFAKLLCSSWPSACISFGIFPCQVPVFAFIFMRSLLNHSFILSLSLWMATLPLAISTTPSSLMSSVRFFWGTFCVVAKVFNKDIKHDQTLRNVTL